MNSKSMTHTETIARSYMVWAKTFPGSKLGEVRLVVDEKFTDDEADPVKYLTTNKVDASSAHIIQSYSDR